MSHQKIIIIKPSGIGDIVHALPVAKAIKILYPNSEIHWLVFTKFAEILKNIDYINQIILWNRNGGIKEYLRVVKLVREQNYDLVIDLQSLMRTALISFFSKGKERITVSLTREFSWLFEKPVTRFNSELHAVERNYEVVKYLTKTDLPSPMELLPWLKPSEEEKKIITKEFGNNQNLVLFSVGSRGKHKIWPQEYYASLINMMNKKYGITPVFVGSKDERPIVEAVISKITCRYIDIAGKTNLQQVVAASDGCKLIIGNDSAIIHIAAALDKPVLGIFGATNPKWYYPYNKKSKYIYKNYPCSPCGIKTFCRDYKCMKDISVEEVFEIAEKMLKS